MLAGGARGVGGAGGDVLCAILLLEVLGMPEAIRCMLLCMLEVLDVLEMLDVL